MAMPAGPMEDPVASAWARFASDVRECKGIDSLIAGKSNAISFDALKQRTERIVGDLRAAYLEHLANRPVDDLSDEHVQSYARYTDGMPLKDYENALDLVPELVNLVSLADALPLDGSSLPLDLKKIAVRCKGAVYFAPRRFTAVQLAFDEPRSRVLLFRTHALSPSHCLLLLIGFHLVCADTGRVVGTGMLLDALLLLCCRKSDSEPTFAHCVAGCDSPTAAKLAVARALKTIAMEAGVHVAVRRFAVSSNFVSNMHIPCPQHSVFCAGA
jgi:hypothetical protein